MSDRRRSLTGPAHDGANAHLSVPRKVAPGDAIALMLHGGSPFSDHEVGRLHPPILVMVPFAAALRRRTHGLVHPAVLRYAVKGWNGVRRSPVLDAHWALDELGRRHPGVPIALVGHSMGGRVALELAPDERVRAVVGLAPWYAEGYPAASFAGTPLLVLHGDEDRVTDARTSEELVRRVEALGGDATFESIHDGHAMLRRPTQWHARTAAFLSARLGGV